MVKVLLSQKAEQHYHTILNFSLVLLALALGACQESFEPTPVDDQVEDSQTTPSVRYQFETPTKFEVTRVGNYVNLFYSPNPKVDLFKIYMDDTQGELNGYGDFDAFVETKANSITHKGPFSRDQTYYFAVSAVNALGEETEKTQTLSVTFPPQEEKKFTHTYDVELNTCIKGSARLTIKDGTLALVGSLDDTLPADHKDCDFVINDNDDTRRGSWVKMTPSTSEEEDTPNSYVFPASAASGGNPHDFDSGALNISPSNTTPVIAQMTNDDVVITQFSQIMDQKCPKGGIINPDKYQVILEDPQTILFDLRNCSQEWERFYFENSIKFKLTFQSTAE